jgi:CRP/FNR family cyclic AMP-dependent transcriptional regulator
MNDDRMEALRAVPLFKEFSEKDLRKTLEIAKEIAHPDGAVFIEEGLSAVGFHLIVEGDAEISVGGRVVGTFGPGDYFGEMSLIDGKPRSASIAGKNGLRTLGISAWNFNRLLDQHPDMMRALLVVLCDRVRRAEQSPHE